ncbi:MAG TPA: hypothetical protein VE244_13520 [Nitrososphaeraceae archaeon]|jgi:hypothetical protein|nr:hypothetical protein [Nitrososphaeraceae archaeon]
MSSYAIMLAVLLLFTMPVIFNYSIHMAFGQELEIGAEFRRQENEFLNDDVIYNMITFNFTTNDNRICPSNTCTYIFEDGQLSPDLITGEYAVDGKLNVNGTSESTTYDVRIDLEVNGILEEGNRTANINAGTIGIGGNALFNPIYKYQVINGTLDFGESTLLYLRATKIQ